MPTPPTSFLDQASAPSAERSLRKSLRRAKMPRYEEFQLHKAVMACVAPDELSRASPRKSSRLAVLGWFIAEGFGDPAKATQVAQAECEEARASVGPCTCHLAWLNDQQILKPTSKTDRQPPSQFEVVDSSSDLATIEAGEGPPRLASSIDFRLRPSTPVVLGHPDCDLLYHCACQDRIRYSLKPVPKAQETQLQRRLESLAAQPAYNCYQLPLNLNSSSHHSPPSSSHQTRCRFLTQVQGSAEGGPEVILTARLDKALAGRTLDELWVEGAFRVDDDYLPLASAELRSRPVALRSGPDWYLVAEETFHIETEFTLPDGSTRRSFRDSQCSLLVVLETRAFDLGVCDDRSACLKTVLSSLFDQLRKEFEREPLGAEPEYSGLAPPGEFWFRRKRKQSLLLGLPYFELSNYVIRWWASDRPRVSAYYLDGLQDTTTRGRFVFLHTRFSSTQALGAKGTYEEPDDRQLEKYSEAVRNALLRALESSCVELGGKQVSGLCTLQDADNGGSEE